MKKWILFAALFVSVPVAAGAQGVIAVDPAYKRAQSLVNDGNVTAGRAIVDSMIAAAAPGSNEYAEGIYWRAVLAATAADAEMDYRRIVVDFSTSPRVEDALIRLAQLEIARGNYDGALRHLNLLATDHPQSPARARAAYWSARAMFDKNDLQGGCAATADALSRVSDTDAELKNQISYLNQRCAGIATAPATPVVAAPAPVPAAVPAPPAASEIVQPPINPSASVPAAKPADTVKSVTPEEVVAPEPVPKKVVLAPVPAPVGPPHSAAGAKKVWSVQIAAYNVKSQAEAMVAKLKKSGYEARVDGEGAPFRVRIGKYATQGQASAVQRSLKAKQIAGFVVQAEIQ